MSSDLKLGKYYCMLFFVTSSPRFLAGVFDILACRYLQIAKISYSLHLSADKTSEKNETSRRS